MILATATPVLNIANMYKKFATNSGSEAISSDVFQVRGVRMLNHNWAISKFLTPPSLSPLPSTRSH